MSKRKFGVEGFGIARQATYNFEPAAGHRRLYIPSPPRPSQHDNYEDHDLDDIDYEDDDDGRNAAAAHSSDWKARIHGGKERQEEDEIDPLDAFMEGIHEEVNRAPAKKETGPENLEDEEEEDPTESFLKARKDTALALAADALHAGYDSDEEVYAAARAVDAANNATLEYDSDDNLIVDRKKIEPLPPLNHSEIDYSLFNRDFYEEMPSISEMSAEDVASYRQSLAIRVSGFDVPRPIKSFEDLGFDKLLMGAICKHDYKRPTPIQCQGLPVALSGRDMLGIAKTGSGKTAAFILPMIVHIMDQEELDEGEGPIAVICAPTRELAQQIYTEAKKFAKVHAIRISAIYGGMSKYEQCKELKAGCEVVVATPGRLIDMLKAKALTLLRTTYLVLDEADRMFDLGFEPQIRSIVGQIRPDRQTLLFSATMPRKVERLAREILSDPVRVTVGEVGSANEDITQLVTVLPSDVEKMPWLLNRLTELVDEGDVLVFASTKVKIQEIESQLNEIGFKAAALHGDMDQASRMEVLQKFKSGIYHVLVATDVAARGLDIKSIKSVVNFDIAKDIDGHVHRIGRTGRAGDKDGVAYTLITQKEARFAGDLVNCLIAAGQNVTTELMDLAMKDSHFRARHEERRGGKKAGGKGQGKGRTRGRSVRGVDFGLGLGYNPETGSKSSAPSARTETQNRGTAVNALKMGMMARFKSNFVAASSGNIAGSGSFTSAADLNKNSYPSRAMSGFVSSGTLASVTPQNHVVSGRAMSGFVSSGTLASVTQNHEVSVSGQAKSGFVTSGTLASVTPQNHEVSSGGRLVSGSGTERDRSQDGQRRWDPNFGPYSSETDRDNRERNNSREHQREKRRSSGWDR